MALGFTIGAVTNDLGLWIAHGTAIGAGVAASLTQHYKNDNNDKS
ncbi:MAG: hypothetical protein ACI86M_003504 [Saprospiraceae bacterium]|jgi:hypothetical protein